MAAVILLLALAASGGAVAAEIFEEGEEGAGKRVEGAPAPAEPVKDPGAWRLVWTQTAFTLPKGKFDFTAFEGGNLYFSFGLSDHFSMTVNTIPPIFYWGAGIHPKVSFQLAPKVRMGIIVNVGFLRPFYFDRFAGNAKGESESHEVDFMYGGAPLLLTIGDEDRFLNISLHLEGVSLTFWEREDGKSDFSSLTDLYAGVSIGGSLKVASHLKVHLEVWTVASPDWKGWLNGRLWAVTPGVRFFTKNFVFDGSVVFLFFPLPEDGDEDEPVEMKAYPPFVGPLVTFSIQTP